MNEPQSIAAEKIALSLLAGTDQCGKPLVCPSDLISVSVGDHCKWPPTTSVTVLDGFTVPRGQALIWTYLSLYTSLTAETETAVNYGINYPATAQIQYRSGASSSSNFVNVTGQVESQGIFNKPLLLIFDTSTLPRIVLYPNASTQTVNRLRCMCESQGYLIPSALSAAFRPHETRIS